MRICSVLSKRTSLISPKFCKDFEELKQLKREFGPFKARFIYHVPNNWSKVLADWTDDFIEPVKKASAFELIRQIKDGGYLIPDPSGQITWDQALERIQTQPDAFEFGVGDFVQPEPLKEWEAVYDKIADTEKTGFLIKGSAKEILFFAEPLIKTAKFIYLIDPYFNPFDDPNHRELLEGIARHTRATKCKTLGIISYNKDHQLPQPLEDKIRDSLMSLIRPGMAVHWHIIRPSYELELHDRYLLTDKGAIGLGKGASRARKDKATLKLNFEGKALHAELLDTFIRPVDLIVNYRSHEAIAVIEHK